jgi:ABC-type multidrug transport system fused ATPase/permease subunit
MTLLGRVGALLGPEERRRCRWLLGMLALMAIFEVLGVASVMPFMAVLARPEVVQSNAALNAVYTMLGFRSGQAFLLFLGFSVFALLLASIAFKALATWVLWRFTNMRSHAITCRLMRSYLEQPYAWYLHRHSADLVRAALADVDRAVNGFLMPVLQLVAHAAVVVLLFGLLVLVNPLIAVGAVLLLGGLYVAVYLALRRYLSRIGGERLQSNLQRYRFAQEVFGGIKEVKAGVLEAAFLQRFFRPSLQFSRADTMVQLVSQLPRFVLEAVAFGGLLLVVLQLFATAGGLAQALPTLAVYAFAGYRMIPSLQQIYANFAQMRFNLPAVDALIADLGSDRAGDGVEPAPVRRPAPMGMKRAVALQDVQFTYAQAERATLRDITLTIPAHTTIGIVGATGAGKTTLVDVLLGLLRPQQGDVVVDGTRIDAANCAAWQCSLGYVPQNIFLIDDSIRANIAFGVPADQIDMRAVERAAQIANLHDFVMRDVSGGYDAVVGDKGVRLSGGQRQRIGIARALYHDPDVLIFDEATSSLDNVTEQIVMDAVHALGGRKTILLIAHRLSTVRECDRIYMLDRGCIEDQGTFAELVTRNQRFRAMAGA